MDRLGVDQERSTAEPVLDAEGLGVDAVTAQIIVDDHMTEASVVRAFAARMLARYDTMDLPQRYEAAAKNLQDVARILERGACNAARRFFVDRSRSTP
jgi:hypothetical protein